MRGPARRLDSLGYADHLHLRALCSCPRPRANAATASCSGYWPDSSGRTSTRRDDEVFDRPVEFDAPAERAAQVELLRHELVDDERQRLVRQRADLHDDAAALGRPRRTT